MATFYNDVSRANWLRPKFGIDYEQFGVDADGKTLYWTPGDKKIPITATRGKFRFLALSILTDRYGEGGSNCVQISMGYSGFTS